MDKEKLISALKNIISELEEPVVNHMEFRYQLFYWNKAQPDVCNLMYRTYVDVKRDALRLMTEFDSVEVYDRMINKYVLTYNEEPAEEIDQMDKEKMIAALQSVMDELKVSAVIDDKDRFEIRYWEEGDTRSDVVDEKAKTYVDAKNKVKNIIDGFSFEHIEIFDRLENKVVLIYKDTFNGKH
jgi:hypothetical protein